MCLKEQTYQSAAALNSTKIYLESTWSYGLQTRGSTDLYLQVYMLFAFADLYRYVGISKSIQVCLGLQIYYRTPKITSSEAILFAYT